MKTDDTDDSESEVSTDRFNALQVGYHTKPHDSHRKKWRNRDQSKVRRKGKERKESESESDPKRQNRKWPEFKCPHFSTEYLLSCVKMAGWWEGAVWDGAHIQQMRVCSCDDNDKVSQSNKVYNELHEKALKKSKIRTFYRKRRPEWFWLRNTRSRLKLKTIKQSKIEQISEGNCVQNRDWSKENCLAYWFI